MVVGPVLVMPVPARTAKGSATPIGTGVAAACALPAEARTVTETASNAAADAAP
jgi:hypothetical protein